MLTSFLNSLIIIILCLGVIPATLQALLNEILVSCLRPPALPFFLGINLLQMLSLLG